MSRYDRRTWQRQSGERHQDPDWPAEVCEYTGRPPKVRVPTCIKRPIAGKQFGGQAQRRFDRQYKLEHV